jgi:hypothetical protein
VREYQPLRPLKPQTPRRCGPATAAAAGLPEPAWELVGCLTSFLLLRSYWASLDAVQERALAACRQAFNRRGEAAIRCARGGHLTEAGHATIGLTQGKAMLTRALAIFLDLDDERGQAKALHALSALERRVGRHQRPAQLASALDHSDQGRLEEAEALLAAATDLWPSQVQGPGFRTSPRRPASGSSWAPMPPRRGPSPCLAMPWPRPGAPTRHTPPDNRPAPSNSMTLAPGTSGHELGVATGKVPVKCRSRAWTHPWGRQGSGWQRRRHGGRQRHHGVGSLRPPRWLGLVASFHDRARGCHMRLRKRLPPCRPAFPRWIPTVQGQGMRRDDGTATACTRCWVARLLVTSD